MRRRVLAAGGFALLAAPLVSVAQPQGVNKSPPGYVVIRVDLGTGPTGAPPANPGGGSGEGGEGLPPPGGGGGPPGGFPGGPPPGFGGPPGGGQQQADRTRAVVVVVPYTRLEEKQQIYKTMPRSAQNPPIFTKITGPAGNAFLFTDGNKVTLNFLQRGRYLPAMVEQNHVNWTRQRLPDNGKALVDEALSYGLSKQAFQYAGEVADAVAGRKDPPKPSVAAFVAAFNSFRTALPKPLPSNPKAAEWQSLLGAAAVAESDHYSLIHWGEASIPKEAVERRLAALENNLKAFYLWAALGGEGLPLPTEKLVAVVADKGSDMPKLQQALDGNPITVGISDAFYSPTHNMIVLSPERRDDIGQAWGNFVQKYYQKGFNRDELLRGTPPQARAVDGALSVAEVMTMALVDRQVDEEAVQAMVTREGSRQLFAVTNKLNPFVLMPEWVETGSSNLLNKPKGPYFHTVNNQPKMTVGLLSGYGMPNYVLVREFVKMQQARELNSKPEEVLMNVLLDKYFDGWRDGKDIDPPPPPQNGGGQALGGGPPGGAFGGSQMGPGGRGSPMGPGGGGSPDGGEGALPSPGGGAPGGFGPQPDQQLDARKLKAKLLTKSQATAWGLTHFLAKRRTAGLLKFYDHLSRMPRDMRLDREQVMLLFCRDFDLMDRRDPSKVNKDEFKSLAVAWLAFMQEYSNFGLDLDVGGQPAGPGGPGGGFPGGGSPGGGFPGSEGGGPGGRG